MANEQLIKLIEQAGDKALQQHMPISSAMIAKELAGNGVGVVVRCKNCKYYDGDAKFCHKLAKRYVSNNFYCAFGTQPQREDV